MPLFLIEKDSATRLPRDCSEEEARAIAAGGSPVFRVTDGGQLEPLEPDSPAQAVETEEVAEVQSEAPSDTVEEVETPKPAAKRAARTSTKKGK